MRRRSAATDIFASVLFLAAALLGIAPAAVADCATNLHGVKPEGYIFYNVDHQVFQGCMGDRWVDLRALRYHEEKNGCTGRTDCPAIGDVCGDGTIYAGCHSAFMTPLFTTRCDAGRTWNGTACTGTRTAQYWVNSASASNIRNTGVVSHLDGEANTRALTEAPGGGACAANQPCDSRTSAGVQAHNAAQYCAGLAMHGHQDWYLPASVELFILASNLDTAADLASGTYWSSTDRDTAGRAHWVSFPAIDVYNYGEKQSALNIRCMRRSPVEGGEDGGSGPCPSGGVDVGGHCWYLGTGNQSCTAVCAGHGLSYSTATRDYAGTGGTLPNCTAVLNALGAPGSGNAQDIPDCGGAYGCVYYAPANERNRCVDVPTNASAALPDTQRACACE